MSDEPGPSPDSARRRAEPTGHLNGQTRRRVARRPSRLRAAPGTPSPAANRFCGDCHTHHHANRVPRWPLDTFALLTNHTPATANEPTSQGAPRGARESASAGRSSSQSLSPPRTDSSRGSLPWASELAPAPQTSSSPRREKPSLVVPSKPTWWMAVEGRWKVV